MLHRGKKGISGLLFAQALKRQREAEEAPDDTKRRRQDSSCWFCIDQIKEDARHLVVSHGDYTYVSLAKGGLVDFHVLIIPMEHYTVRVRARAPVQCSAVQCSAVQCSAVQCPCHCQGIVPPLARAPCQSKNACRLRNFWSCGIWRFFLWLSMKTGGFLWGWYFRDSGCCPATHLLSFGGGDWGITALRRASNFGLLVLFSPGAGGGAY